jgi:choloylglycine hydrolase
MPKQEPKARSVLNLKIAIVAAAAAGAMLAAPQIADACTRILWNNNKLAVVVGRTMDWPEST